LTTRKIQILFHAKKQNYEKEKTNQMGYVVVPGVDTDIKVKRENVKNAMHGDTVEVVIIRTSKTTQKPEGLVTNIVKRGQSEMIGTVEMNMNFAFVVPDNKSLQKIFLSMKKIAKD
jgi:ribonuclease R